jgi:hypothetical protein
MTIKYTKWPYNISNGRKIDQMVIKYTKIFYSKTLQNLPDWDFWFVNKPSGSPAKGASLEGSGFQHFLRQLVLGELVVNHLSA